MVCGPVECNVDERIISSHYRGNLSMNNYFLTTLWNIKQFPRYCIKWRYRIVHCKTWTQELVLPFVTSLLPSTLYIYGMIRIKDLLHRQMLWIYYRLVAFHICNTLPLNHDNKSCVKEIAYAQLKTETNYIHTRVHILLQQFFLEKHHQIQNACLGNPTHILWLSSCRFA